MQGEGTIAVGRNKSRKMTTEVLLRMHANHTQCHACKHNCKTVPMLQSFWVHIHRSRMNEQEVPHHIVVAAQCCIVQDGAFQSLFQHSLLQAGGGEGLGGVHLGRWGIVTQASSTKKRVMRGQIKALHVVRCLTIMNATLASATMDSISEAKDNWKRVQKLDVLAPHRALQTRKTTRD